MIDVTTADMPTTSCQGSHLIPQHKHAQLFLVFMQHKSIKLIRFVKPVTLASRTQFKQIQHSFCGLDFCFHSNNITIFGIGLNNAFSLPRDKSKQIA